MGRRKFWHALGTVLLLMSYPLVYVYPLLFPEDTDVFRHFNIHICVYVFLIAMFQSAWAMVQVSHVSLITDLTSVQNERVALNAYR
jgi:Na+/melibiose symporter-like transporter